MKRIEWLDQTFYPKTGGHWDDDLFRERVLDQVGDRAPDLLDIGAGAGILPQMDFRDRAGRVCGIDPDARVSENPYLLEARQGHAEDIPYPDESFDIAIANNVLEHLPEPARVFREVYRVLRPGGVFMAKTPNRIHYVPLVASLTPHRFHEWINRIRGRSKEDTFPTLYRANTPRKVKRLASAAGFRDAAIDLVEGRPEYLRFSSIPYAFGIAYERLVNGVSALRFFRVLLLMRFLK